MLPCWLHWPASLVALVSIRGTWLISAANLHVSGCSTLTLLCFTLEDNSTSNENTHFFSLWKCYRHEWECLLSFHSHVEQKQEHWERKAVVWNHGQMRIRMRAKSPTQRKEGGRSQVFRWLCCFHFWWLWCSTRERSCFMWLAWAWPAMGKGEVLTSGRFT